MPAQRIDAMAKTAAAEQRCLAEWESDERIDREHSPSRPPRATSAARNRAVDDAGSDENDSEWIGHEHYHVGSWDSD